MCDVCGLQVAPEDVRYLMYAMTRSLPVLFPVASLTVVEGHDGCLLPLVEGLKT